MSESRPSAGRCPPRMVVTCRMALRRWVAARADGLGEVSFALLVSVVVAGLMFGACGAPDEVVRHANPARLVAAQPAAYPFRALLEPEALRAPLLNRAGGCPARVAPAILAAR